METNDSIRNRKGFTRTIELPRCLWRQRVRQPLNVIMEPLRWCKTPNSDSLLTEGCWSRVQWTPWGQCWYFINMTEHIYFWWPSNDGACWLVLFSWKQWRVSELNKRQHPELEKKRPSNVLEVKSINGWREKGGIGAVLHECNVKWCWHIEVKEW
jgi:hypothetical protein